MEPVSFSQGSRSWMRWRIGSQWREFLMKEEILCTYYMQILFAHIMCKTHLCALQVFLCALVSWPVCARTRAQLRGNIDRYFFKSEELHNNNKNGLSSSINFLTKNGGSKSSSHDFEEESSLSWRRVAGRIGWKDGCSSGKNRRRWVPRGLSSRFNLSLYKVSVVILRERSRRWRCGGSPRS